MKRCVLAFALAVCLGVAAMPGRFVDAKPVSGQVVVAEARQFLGYPYAYTGADPSTGFSCIGFVYYVYHQLGVDMPGDLGDAMAAYPHVAETQLLPGDIVFFQNTWWPGVSHVAIYIGNGRVIHAENPQRGVAISAISGDPVEGDYWQQHYLVAERPWDGPLPAVTPTDVPLATPLPTAVPTAEPALPQGPTVTVQVSALNLRNGPSMSAGIITVVPQGTTLLVLGQSNGWLHVQLADGTIGWVVKWGVSGLDAQAGTTPTPTPQPTAQPTAVPTTARPARTQTTVFVLVNGLRVHQWPALKAPVVTSLPAGQRVTQVGTAPGWAQVRVRAGVSGWVVSRGVARRAPQPHRPRGATQQHASAHATVYTTAAVRLRAGPSLSAHIITVLQPRTPLTLLRVVAGWDQVELQNRQQGYVFAAYLTTR